MLSLLRTVVGRYITYLIYSAAPARENRKKRPASKSLSEIIFVMVSTMDCLKLNCGVAVQRQVEVHVDPRTTRMLLTIGGDPDRPLF